MEENNKYVLEISKPDLGVQPLNNTKTEPTQSPVKPKRAFKKWLVLGLVLALIIASGIGSLYYLNSNKQIACTAEAKLCPDGSSVGRTGPKCEFAKCPTITSTPAATVQSTLTASETANWKTFSNNGVSFKYPADFDTRDHTSSIRKYLNDKNNLLSVSFIPLNTGPGFEFYIEEGDFDALVNSTIKAEGGNPDKTSKIVYNSNIQAIKASTPGPLPDMYNHIFIPNGKKIISFIIIKEEQKLLDQILSTFKFTEQTNPTPTCRPRPACLDAIPRCMIPETSDMCPPTITPLP